MVFIYGDRFRSNIEDAIPTAGIQSFSSLFVLHEPAATSTENNSGALVSSSAFCFSKEKSSILSLSGDCRQLCFFFGAKTYTLIVNILHDVKNKVFS